MALKTAPISSPVMIEPEFLIELLITTLDSPARFGLFDESRDRPVRRQNQKPIFGRLAFTPGPFDEKRFFGVGRRTPIVAMSRLDPSRGETEAEIFIPAFEPCDSPPSILETSPSVSPT